jgi:hypothetical protein
VTRSRKESRWGYCVGRALGGFSQRRKVAKGMARGGLTRSREGLEGF